MPKTIERTVKKIQLQTAAIFAGVMFLTGFITAMVLPVGNFPVSFFRGSGNFDTNDVDERIRVLEAETEKNPLDEKVWADLGELYNDSGLIDKALIANQKVLSINPNNADAWAEIGTLHHKSGRPDKAVEAFDKAIAVDPNTRAHDSSKGLC